MKRDGRTIGERVSDTIAKFGGSWKFIFIFAGFLVLWIIVNALQLTKIIHWDEYPFILLNLCLSFIAAFQAPFIMMSQNRSAQKQADHHENMINNLTVLVQKIIELSQKDLDIDEDDMASLEDIKKSIDVLSQKLDRIQPGIPSIPSIPSIPILPNPITNPPWTVGDPIWRYFTCSGGTTTMLSGTVTMNNTEGPK